LSESAVATQEQDRRLLLPIAEVSELTGVSVHTLKRRAPARQIGTLWLIPRSWVEHITSWCEEVAS